MIHHRAVRVLLVMLLGLALVACGQTADQTADQPPDPANPPARLLGPAEYAAMLDDGERLVINVHTPDEGSIQGTDLAIPFDAIEQRSSDLPADGDTPIALYCMSGNMSATAARALAEMGYDDIVDLRGGMEAWRASGRRLQTAGN